MVKNSLSTTPQVEENKKHYTDHNVKRYDNEIQFQNITSQPVKKILHTVDNNIIHNLPILWEDVRMNEDIYVTSVPNLQGRTVHRKIQHVEPIIVSNSPKGILNIYKKFTLFCDIMHINGPGFLNTTYWNIIFATWSMI